MLIGLGISTCREGLAYPAGFANLQQTAKLAQEAEQLGFGALWGNDHLATQQVVLDTLVHPPNFYEPLTTFAYLAGQVPRLRVVVATVVAPLRDPVLLAKQVATLDQASEGRFTLGLGIGAYREEFNALFPAKKGAHRGRMMGETVEVLRRLTSQRRASFDGEFYHFTEIEMFPKPVQDPLPIFVSASTPATIERAAHMADGLILAGATPERIAESTSSFRAAAEAAGREADTLQVCAQMWVGIGTDQAAASAILRDSQHFKRIQALRPDKDVGELEREFAEHNLLGDPDTIGARIQEYSEAGIDQLGLIFLAQNIDELRNRAALFGETILTSAGLRI